MNNPIALLRSKLFASPHLFPFQLHDTRDEVLLVRLSEDDIHQASFLDGRMWRDELQSQAAWIPWPILAEASQSMTIAIDYIFHISHCGSTLLSKLLGEHASVHSLREPLPLRTIVHRRALDRLPIFLSLWSRTYRSNQRTLLKATSFVSEIGSDMMRASFESKAILMYIPIESFLPSLLDGSMSDIDSQSQSRWTRLSNMGIALPDTIIHLSPGERVAMSWLAEMGSLTQIASHFPDRTLWINFEHLLQNVAPELKAAFTHLGYTVNTGPWLDSPILRQYAKRPEVAYDTDFRNRLIAVGAAKHADEIRRGLRWLDQPALADLRQRINRSTDHRPTPVELSR